MLSQGKSSCILLFSPGITLRDLRDLRGLWGEPTTLTTAACGQCPHWNSHLISPGHDHDPYISNFMVGIFLWQFSFPSPTVCLKPILPSYSPWKKDPGKCLVIPPKGKLRVSVWSNSSTNGYISKRTDNVYPDTNLYMYVHSSIIHNWETPQIPINWQLDRWMRCICTMK